MGDGGDGILLSAPTVGKLFKHTATRITFSYKLSGSIKLHPHASDGLSPN